MAAGVVTIRPSLPGQPVMGKVVYDGSPVLTPVYVGFVPSKFVITNATDRDVSLTWTSDMADASGITDAGAAVSSGGITPLADTGGMGVSVGTDASCMEASKTYTFEAYR